MSFVRKNVIRWRSDKSGTNNNIVRYGWPFRCIFVSRSVTVQYCSVVFPAGIGPREDQLTFHKILITIRSYRGGTRELATTDEENKTEQTSNPSWSFWRLLPNKMMTRSEEKLREPCGRTTHVPPKCYCRIRNSNSRQHLLLECHLPLYAAWFDRRGSACLYTVA